MTTTRYFALVENNGTITDVRTTKTMPYVACVVARDRTQIGTCHLTAEAARRKLASATWATAIRGLTEISAEQYRAWKKARAWVQKEHQKVLDQLADAQAEQAFLSECLAEMDEAHRRIGVL